MPTHYRLKAEPIIVSVKPGMKSQLKVLVGRAGAAFSFQWRRLLGMRSR